MDQLEDKLTLGRISKRRGMNRKVGAKGQKIALSTASRTARRFISKANALPDAVKEKISEDSAAVEYRRHSLKKEISSGGIVELIFAKDDKQNNVKTFDKDKFGEQYNIRRLELMYESALTAGSPEVTDVNYRPIRKEPLYAGVTSADAVLVAEPADDPGLINAELVLRKGGREVFRADVADFTQGDTQNVNSEQNGINLNDIIEFDFDETVTADLVMASAIATPASSSHFVKLTFVGTALATA